MSVRDTANEIAITGLSAYQNNPIPVKLDFDYCRSQVNVTLALSLRPLVRVLFLTRFLAFAVEIPIEVLLQVES